VALPHLRTPTVRRTDVPPNRGRGLVEFVGGEEGWGALVRRLEHLHEPMGNGSQGFPSFRHLPDVDIDVEVLEDGEVPRGNVGRGVDSQEVDRIRGDDVAGYWANALIAHRPRLAESGIKRRFELTCIWTELGSRHTTRGPKSSRGDGDELVALFVVVPAVLGDEGLQPLVQTDSPAGVPACPYGEGEARRFFRLHASTLVNWKSAPGERLELST
jgi:hypothetical protein